MKKIFISHNQDFTPAIDVKRLINMFGAQGILVEDEPGAESPRDKSFRLLKESQGFLAICTKDVLDQSKYGPKHNVVLEIQEWQKRSKNKNLVLLKEDGCELPKLLDDPTFKLFKGKDFLSAVVKAIQEFQNWGVIPTCQSDKKSKENDIALLPEYEEFLEFLASCNNHSTHVVIAREKFKQIQERNWNLMINFLHLKEEMIDIEYLYGNPYVYRITFKGMEYLREKASSCSR